MSQTRKKSIEEPRKGKKTKQSTSLKKRAIHIFLCFKANEMAQISDHRNRTVSNRTVAMLTLNPVLVIFSCFWPNRQIDSPPSRLKFHSCVVSSKEGTHEVSLRTNKQHSTIIQRTLQATICFSSKIATAIK